MQTRRKSPRRDFLKKAIAAAAGPLCTAGLFAQGSDATQSESKETLSREAVVGKLRGRIKALLEDLERKTHLTVEFRPLARNFAFAAQYTFEQPNRPIVQLRRDWQDVDAAHELMHMQLELVDGHPVLAWRKNVPREKPVEMAFGLVRSYTDDFIVFERLARMGLKIDGEIIKHQFFDDICTKVPRYLKQGRPLKNDGMAHFDNVAGGRYATLRRSAFLVQAELIMKLYADHLSDEHKRLAKDFIRAFRRFRPEQAARADKVLHLFKKHNVQQIKAHARILSRWAALEGLNTWVGLSTYIRRDDGFTLPFPSQNDTLEA